MNLTEEILAALTKGENAMDVMRKAKAAGVSQADAIAATRKVFDLLPPEDPAKKDKTGYTLHDYATEVNLLAAGWCHPSHRLWKDE